MKEGTFMWSRVTLKNNAKLVLKFNYWKAFLVTFLVGLVGGGFSGVSYRYTNGNYNSQYYNYNPFYYDDFSYLLGIILGALAVILLIAMTVGLLYYLFVLAPLQVSQAKYFIAQREQPGDLNNLLYCFKSGKYLNIVKAMGWQYLFTFLWSLLFVIPGIVKAYSYRMVPYIMAENPDMDYRQAMKLSMAMTQGLKGDLFILDLSFLGWYLLGALACGVGVLFVRPYHEATLTEAYIFIRERAISIGICPRETFMPAFGQYYQNYNQPPMY